MSMELFRVMKDPIFTCTICGGNSRRVATGLLGGHGWGAFWTCGECLNTRRGWVKVDKLWAERGDEVAQG